MSTHQGETLQPTHPIKKGEKDTRTSFIYKKRQSNSIFVPYFHTHLGRPIRPRMSVGLTHNAKSWPSFMAFSSSSVAGDEGGHWHLDHVQGLLHDGLELQGRHFGRRQAHADHQRTREAVQGAEHGRGRQGSRGP